MSTFSKQPIHAYQPVTRLTAWARKALQILSELSKWGRAMQAEYDRFARENPEAVRAAQFRWNLDWWF